MQAAVLHTKS